MILCALFRILPSTFSISSLGQLSVSMTMQVTGRGVFRCPLTLGPTMPLNISVLQFRLPELGSLILGLELGLQGPLFRSDTLRHDLAGPLFPIREFRFPLLSLPLSLAFPDSPSFDLAQHPAA